MNSIGDRILDIRKGMRLSQEKFGELCGLSRPSIMRYETGVNEPSREAAKKIADAAHVSVDWLLFGDDVAPLAPQQVTDTDLKFALFGDPAADITDEQFEEIKRYAQYLREKRKHDKR